MERHGELPQTISVGSREEMYESMAAKIRQLGEFDTIAVLTLDEDSANKAAKELRTMFQEEEIHLLTKDSMHFSTGISVMPFYLAKGLEFDAVLVPDLQNYKTPLEQQALYIDATRALHVLKLFKIA